MRSSMRKHFGTEWDNRFYYGFRVFREVLTNATIIDLVLGIIKVIGVKMDSYFCHAGNPLIQSGITEGMVIGAGTEVIAAEGHIVTAGGFDSHIHFICPQQINEALTSGITTMTGGGTGPATGTNATTCTPGIWNIKKMLEAAEAIPMNLGFMGKGKASNLLPYASSRSGCNGP